VAAIINIVSTAGHQGRAVEHRLLYGQERSCHFTRSVAMELPEYGIRVKQPDSDRHGCCRGYGSGCGVGRSLSTANEPQPTYGRGFLSGSPSGVPLGKRPSPSDYAKAAVFLASDDAAMITGTDLRVDAGRWRATGCGIPRYRRIGRWAPRRPWRAQHIETVAQIAKSVLQRSLGGFTGLKAIRFPRRLAHGRQPSRP